jgi:hypothetical protein
MNSLRTFVEWPYGDIIVLLHIMQNKHKKNVLPTGLLNVTLHQQFRVVFFFYIIATFVLTATSLRSFLTCLLLHLLTTLRYRFIVIILYNIIYL